MKRLVSGLAVTVAACVMLAAAAACAQSVDASAAVAGLPLQEMPVATSGRELVFLITGDGGLAAGDRGIADTFVAHGVPVVALDSRAYLKQKRYPDGVASDASRIMRHYLAAWHRDSVLFVGYSRGADMAPFIITRLTPDLRDRLSLVTMIGLAERASFEFHWLDLIKDVNRSTDYPVAPELLKIHGVPMLCLYAAKDKDSLCPAYGPPVMQVEQLGSRHAMSRADGVAVAERILRERR